MSIKIKLIMFSLLCLLIPGIIISVTSYQKAADAALETGIRNLNATARTQALSANTYIGKIQSEADDMVLDPQIKTYAASATAGTASESLETYVNEQLRTLARYNPDLVEVMIIGENGKVLNSTIPYSIGSAVDNYSELMENPGVSGFEPHEDANGETKPSFSISTNIYSDNNIIVGVLFERFYTGSLETIITNAGANVATSLAISDKNNNLLIYDYKIVVNMSDKSTEFGQYLNDISRNMEFLFSTDAPGEVVEPFTATGSNGNSRIIAMAEIPKSDWVFISSTDQKAFANNINLAINNFPLVIFLLILGTAGLIYIGIYFLNPLAAIMQVLNRKASGADVATRISFTDRKDEFDDLRDIINNLFDRITEGELKYETMVEMTNNIVFTIDLKNSTVETSQNFNRKFSFRPKDDSVEESFIYKMRVHKDDKEKYLGDMDAILKEANFMDGEYRIRNRYNDFAWVMIKATKFFDRNEMPSKIIGVIVDIDKDKNYKINLLQQAQYDALTSIFNRITFIKNLTETIEMNIRRKDLVAILFIDLDDFKHFNDDFSHACGDEVLKFTADTLKEITFEKGFAGRFGGDEFVCCLTKLTLYSDAGNIAQEIIDILSRGFISDSTGVKLVMHCSIGISFLHEQGHTSDEIIDAADAAMYNIKKHGKSGFAYAQKGDTLPESKAIPKPIDGKQD